MNKIRLAIAEALGIQVKDLGCFTLCDHDGQPAILVVHGEQSEGVWVEFENATSPTGMFIRVYNK